MAVPSEVVAVAAAMLVISAAVPPGMVVLPAVVAVAVPSLVPRLLWVLQPLVSADVPPDVVPLPRQLLVAVALPTILSLLLHMLHRCKRAWPECARCVPGAHYSTPRQLRDSDG